MNDDGNNSNHWKGKEIIPLNDWIQLRGTPYALEYFPDDFNKFWTFLTERKLKDGDDQIKVLCCIIQKLRYLVTLLTLITNGPDTNYHLLTEDFKVS